jgi:multicomponent K+:H+ antiporter subunit A
MGLPATLPVVVLLPWLAVPLLWLARRGPRMLAAWLSGIAMLAALALLIGQAPAVFSGETVAFSQPWVPGLGLALSFRVDGLAFLFAFLILAIGLLIVLYAAYYLSDEPGLARFYALLMFFAGAMLGVALSGNLLLLFVFWELTSVSSFLLVGYWWRKSDARDGARVALAVTGGGGLALLAGILLLGHVAGSFELSVVLASRETIQASPLYLPILTLVLLGAFTKSAQFPFHFWLPGAMAAPTPVSAYLHSATMVKAGIFLMARLYPVLSGSDAWFFTLVAVGLTTLVFGAYQAIFKHDLKGLLAYSTVSHLGLITLLLGLSTPLGAVAAVFHIMNHATFKASLFMAAGIIDHECGTRDMRRINGLWKYMPYTGLLATVAAASMAGVPLANGFLSKEMFFGEAIALERGGGLKWIMPLAAVAGGVFSVAYSLRFIHDVFFHGEPVDLPKKPHEPPRWMRVPVEILVVLCVFVGVLPALSVAPILHVAAQSVIGAPLPPFSLAIWHGLNTPLIMSAVALGLGILLYFLIQYGLDLHSHVQGKHVAKRVLDRLVYGLAATGNAVVRRLSQGGLTTSLLLAVLVAGLAGVSPFLLVSGSIGTAGATPAEPMALAVFALMSVAALGMAFTHRNRLLALVLVSVVGLMNALAFVYFSAPDLALTQVAVEVVTILLLLLALNFLPQDAPPERSVTRALRDFGLGILAGGGVAWLAWAVLTRPFDSISTYFVDQSVPQGGGSNVVNVILVDFRGFDTYGEITVIAIAALGIAALLSGLRLPARSADSDGRPFAPSFSPMLLSRLTRLLLPLALTVSVFIFLRGHNEPGGGFVAGLVTAVALVLQYFGSGGAFARPRLPLNGRVIAAAGLLVAGATGAGAFAFGRPFLTSAHGYVQLPLIGDVHLASAIAFDLGVYLTVVGGVMLILTLLGSGDHPELGKRGA